MDGTGGVYLVWAAGLSKLQQERRARSGLDLQGIEVHFDNIPAIEDVIELSVKDRVHRLSVTEIVHEVRPGDTWVDAVHRVRIGVIYLEELEHE